MKTGKYVNVPPYGYQRDPDDKHHLLPDPDTAPVVRRIFQMIIDGSSTTQVAAALNQEGIPTPLLAKGIRRKKGMLCEKPLMWTHTAVLSILGNYKYTGAMVNHSRESATLRARSQRKVPKKDWIINEGMHEGLVSHEEYDLARQALRKVNNYSRKDMDFSKSVYYCGHCGRRLRRTYGKTIYLSCQTGMYQKEAECRQIRLTLPEMEETMLDSFEIQLCFLRKMKKKQKTEKQDLDKGFIRKIAEIKRQMEACNARKMQLYTEYRSGSLSRDGFIFQKTEQTKEADRLTALMEETKAAYERYQQEKSERQEKQEALGRYVIEEELTREEMLKLMYQGVDKVLVYVDGTVDITWKFQDVFAGMTDEIAEKEEDIAGKWVA